MSKPPQSKPPERALVTFTRLDAVQPRPLQPIVDGILYADTLAAIIGASGSCKSFVAQSIAASIATGTPWHGYDVAQGPVFYLAGEGQGGLEKRFNGWFQHHGIQRAGAPIYLASCLPPLHDLSNAAAVIGAITESRERGAPPRLVVVDTYARAMAGSDENSAADVGSIIQNLDWMRNEWQCCVLLVHHTGHGENSSGRGRGSSAFYAALDTEMLVKSDGGPVSIKTTKAKDWEPAADLHLARHVVELEIAGQAETTLVLVDGVPAPAVSDADLRDQIRELKAEGLSIRAIAAATGKHRSAVERLLKAMDRDPERYRSATDGD